MLPDDDPIVATAVLLLLHVPPGVAFVNVVDDPAQSELRPDMPDSGFTVTVIVVTQPPGIV